MVRVYNIQPLNTTIKLVLLTPTQTDFIQNVLKDVIGVSTKQQYLYWLTHFELSHSIWDLSHLCDINHIN